MERGSKCSVWGYDLGSHTRVVKRSQLRPFGAGAVRQKDLLGQDWMWCAPGEMRPGRLEQGVKGKTASQWHYRYMFNLIGHIGKNFQFIISRVGSHWSLCREWHKICNISNINAYTHSSDIISQQIIIPWFVSLATKVLYVILKNLVIWGFATYIAFKKLRVIFQLPSCFDQWILHGEYWFL